MGSFGRRSITSDSDEMFALAVCGLSGSRSATLGDVTGASVSQALNVRLSAAAAASQNLETGMAPFPTVPAAQRLESGESAGGARRARSGLGLHRQQAFALQLLARQLARPAHRLGLLPRPLLRRLLVVPAQLHFAKNALALHLLLQRLESLIDIIVANENLHGSSCFRGF